MRLCFAVVVGWSFVAGAAVRAAESPAKFSDPPSFVNDVEPLLTRLGCNQGACHGKGVGQAGFRLSLRGYAPELDHPSLTREYAGRRVNRAEPEASLLLRKAVGEVPHGGGALMARDSDAYRLLKAWLVAGAPGPAAEERSLVALRMSPEHKRAKVDEAISLKVTAEYDDGATRDVTWLAQFASNDSGIVRVAADGLATVAGSGETALRAQFQGRVAVAVVTVPFERPEPTFDVAAAGLVDQPVFARLKDLRIPASPRCDDAVFLRRASLDLTGTLPTAAELADFENDRRPDKRARAVDRLLERPEFVDFWTLLWGDLLQNRKERDHDVRGAKGVRSFHTWLRNEVARNTPWDELVRKVLTATGDTRRHPEVGYYVVTIGEARQVEKSDVTAAAAQAFLGTRIGCAKCHNHPLEKFTQDDFYHFAAAFARIDFERQKPELGPTTLVVLSEQEQNLRKRREQITKKIAELNAATYSEDVAEAEKAAKDLLSQRKQLDDVEKQIAAPFDPAKIGVNQPRTGKFMKPQGLDRAPLEIAADGDPRASLVRWMTDGKNAEFNGAIVNRLWKHFLGTGLVEPVDDLRASNPPSNPELWDALSRELVTHKYDLKHLMRVIVNSETYQRSSKTLPENAADARYYSHYYARRLPAEVLLDAISRVTGVPDKFEGYPVGVRAVQLPDPGMDSYFLTLFGRSPRTTACACERMGEVTMSQLLHLQNGDTVLEKIESPVGRLTELLKAEPNDVRVVERLFLETVGRRPSLAERATINQQLTGGDPRDEVFRDLLWALLNSKEFTFNR